MGPDKGLEAHGRDALPRVRDVQLGAGLDREIDRRPGREDRVLGAVGRQQRPPREDHAGLLYDRAGVAHSVSRTSAEPFKLVAPPLSRSAISAFKAASRSGAATTRSSIPPPMPSITETRFLPIASLLRRSLCFRYPSLLHPEIEGRLESFEPAAQNHHVGFVRVRHSRRSSLRASGSGTLRAPSGTVRLRLLTLLYAAVSANLDQ